MAEETLVEEMRKVIRQLQRKKGSFVLAMLLATSAEPTAPWNFVLSAEWLDNVSRKQAVNYVMGLLRSHLSRGHWPHILMVSVLRTDDPFVRGLNAAFAAEDSSVMLQDCSVNGFEIPRAILFESHRPGTIAPSKLGISVASR